MQRDTAVKISRWALAITIFLALCIGSPPNAFLVGCAAFFAGVTCCLWVQIEWMDRLIELQLYKRMDDLIEKVQPKPLRDERGRFVSRKKDD